MQSLKDKLLKAGLVTEEQTRKVTEKPRAENGYRVPVVRAPRPPAAESNSSIPKLPPMPGSPAYQRVEALKQQELAQKLRELVLTTQVAIETGQQVFHFATRKGKLRRLELSPAQAALLEKGELAVVERQEPAMIEHSLVPAAAAEKMLSLSAKAVRFFNRPGAPVGFDSEVEGEDDTAAEPANEP